MRKGFLILTLLLAASTACTIAKPGTHHNRQQQRELAKEKLADIIRTEMGKYYDQAQPAELTHEPPHENVQFGEITYKLPDTIRVYSKGYERDHGGLSEVTPTGWRVVYRKGGAVVKYSDGTDKYTPIKHIDLLDQEGEK